MLHVPVYILLFWSPNFNKANFEFYQGASLLTLLHVAASNVFPFKGIKFRCFCVCGICRVWALFNVIFKNFYMNTESKGDALVNGTLLFGAAQSLVVSILVTCSKCDCTGLMVAIFVTKVHCLSIWPKYKLAGIGLNSSFSL